MMVSECNTDFDREMGRGDDCSSQCAIEQF